MQTYRFGHRGDSRIIGAPNGRRARSNPSGTLAPNSARYRFHTEARRMHGPLRSRERHSHRAIGPSRKFHFRHSLRRIARDTGLFSVHRKGCVVRNNVPPPVSTDSLAGYLVAPWPSVVEGMEGRDNICVAGVADVFSDAFASEWR